MTAVLPLTEHVDFDDKDRVPDKVFGWTVATAATLVMVVLLGAALAMLYGGRLAFETFGWKFFINSEWDAVNKNFGALVPILGTLIS